MSAENLLVPCPFPDRTNSLGPLAAEYARGVATEIGLLGEASAAVLYGMALGDAAALTYPDADLDRLRVATLWIAFLVLFDDAWSDLLAFDGDWRVRVLAQHRTVEQMLAGRPAGTGDDPLVRLLHRILVDIAAIAPDWDSSRLRREIRRYLGATVWELDHRSRAHIPDLSSYLYMRRVFSTMTVQLELDYLVCRLYLSEEVRTHPCLQLVDRAVADYGTIANDLYSLTTERQRGITSNAVTVLQHEHGWDVETATAYARRMCGQALQVHREVSDEPARFGLPGQDENLRRYLDHYEAFMSAAARWPARSARYRNQPADAAATPLTIA